jgi:prepilin-type N-terminal cleavage/methylation domain-containing protein
MYNTRILKINNKNANRGYTLIEIIISLVITSVLVLVIAQVSYDFIKGYQRNMLTSTRDQLAVVIRQYAGSINSLKATLARPENIQFRNCVCGTGAGCASAQPYPLVLYDAGSAVKPVPMYYDSSGFSCDPAATNCVIEVTVRFIAQCMPTLPSSDPLPSANCVGVPVEFIAVLYDVKQNPLKASQGIVLKPMSGAVYTPVVSLAPASSGVCP